MTHNSSALCHITGRQVTINILDNRCRYLRPAPSASPQCAGLLQRICSRLQRTVKVVITGIDTTVGRPHHQSAAMQLRRFISAGSVGRIRQQPVRDQPRATAVHVHMGFMLLLKEDMHNAAGTHPAVWTVSTTLAMWKCLLPRSVDLYTFLPLKSQSVRLRLLLS